MYEGWVTPESTSDLSDPGPEFLGGRADRAIVSGSPGRAVLPDVGERRVI